MLSSAHHALCHFSLSLSYPVHPLLSQPSNPLSLVYLWLSYNSYPVIHFFCALCCSSFTLPYTLHIPLNSCTMSYHQNSHGVNISYPVILCCATMPIYIPCISKSITVAFFLSRIIFPLVFSVTLCSNTLHHVFLSLHASVTIVCYIPYDFPCTNLCHFLFTHPVLPNVKKTVFFLAVKHVNKLTNIIRNLKHNFSNLIVARTSANAISKCI